MVFNDTFILEFLILLCVICYVSSTNLMMLLYTAGLYLIFIGVFALVNDADIYIGFLWVIDLGVGLVFFIFILHFTSFLFQKSQFNLTARHFLFGYLIIITLLTSLILLRRGLLWSFKLYWSYSCLLRIYDDLSYNFLTNIIRDGWSLGFCLVNLILLFFFGCLNLI